MEKNIKLKNSIERLLNEKLEEEEILRMFDLPCNFYFIFEHIFKNKIKDKRILQKSWDIIENSDMKMPGDGYYLWYFGDAYLFKLTGSHSDRYINDEEGKRVIDWLLSSGF